jgi:NTE family protein
VAKQGGKSGQKSINLALQGGGAHGAFTWGVLDRLFEDGRIRIEAVSGTSAGAMNAVVAADGLMRAGEDGARDGLMRFWKAVSDAARLSPIQRGPIDVFMGNWSLDNNPTYLFFDLLHRVSSPYDVNPLNLNPLKTILDDIVDFDLVRSCDSMKVFISATNVETGRVEVFDRRELTCDMVVASACIPLLFQAVEINGVPFWDGGYMGNPVLFPFYRASTSDDIVLVQINPVERKGTPRSAREILNRVDEITFNGSLLKELRAIDFVQRLLQDGKLDPKLYRRLHVHVIEAQDRILPLGASSKLNAEWRFLRHLFEIGREAAEAWIEKSYDHLGQHSTVNTRAMFHGAGAPHARHAR